MEIDHIYNMDCLEGMRQMEADSVDLTVTSPPYDNLRTYNGYCFDFENIAKELYRITRSGGVVVWVVGDETTDGSESLTSFRQAIGFTEIGFNLHDTMVYMKDNPCPVGGNNRYYQAFEYMFVFSKGAPKTFNPLTEPRRNKWNDNRTERTKGFQRNADGTMTPKHVQINQGDPKRRNVWTYSLGASEHTGHPAVFPEMLAADHIRSWSNEGDTILDPFMGSGTTAKVARALNRHYIGFEISAEYCEIIRKRMEQTKTLFDI